MGREAVAKGVAVCRFGNSGHPNHDYAYKTTARYAPELYRGIVWNDPTVGVEWPISDPVLVARDAAFPTLEKADINYRYG
ncbi:MAG: hypothetical protein HOC74_44420 [Gemmatimonadetes bacterium]|nr:hypothetical protein [Gemmatimonadota bacterium]